LTDELPVLVPLVPLLIAVPLALSGPITPY
jgi:hypothetical protein